MSRDDSHGISLSSRLKFNKLKYGSENIPLEDQKSASQDASHFDDGKNFLSLRNHHLFFRLAIDENKEDANLAFAGSSVSFKQGRQLLRQYAVSNAKERNERTVVGRLDI